MPYQVPFKIGDRVTLKGSYTYKGDKHAANERRFANQIGIVETAPDSYGLVKVLWPPEITGHIRPIPVDAWCLEAANKPPTDDEIAEAFGLIGMPAIEEQPSDGHLNALYRITQEGDWARERLEHYLGKDWHRHFEEE